MWTLLLLPRNFLNLTTTKLQLPLEQCRSALIAPSPFCADSPLQSFATLVIVGCIHEDLQWCSSSRLSDKNIPSSVLLLSSPPKNFLQPPLGLQSPSSSTFIPTIILWTWLVALRQSETKKQDIPFLGCVTRSSRSGRNATASTALTRFQYAAKSSSSV